MFGTPFDDLRLGQPSQVIIGRLLSFLDSHNIKKNWEFMEIILLLLDEKVTTSLP